jgi:hypothetical protein
MKQHTSRAGVRRGGVKGHLDRCPKDRCAKGPYISISFRRLLGIADGMTTSVDERRSDLLCDISYLRKIDVRRSLGDAPLLPSSA